jgi:hypothetical protein
MPAEHCFTESGRAPREILELAAGRQAADWLDNEP